MHPPTITAAYTAVLALFYVGLSLRVARLRRGNRVAFGDAGNAELKSAIRAHAHFAEYVPLILLMVAILEMSGLGATRVHLLLATLVVARLIHPIGMTATPLSLPFRIGRVGGMMLTMLVMTASALLILWRAVAGS